MKKHSIIILAIIAITTTSLLGCNGKVNQSTAKSENLSTISNEVTELYEIESFLKNTIYIYKNATLTDYNYTPSKKYSLNNITVKVNNNTLTVKAGQTITHKLKSAKYYQYHDATGHNRMAIIQTDKGEIGLAESNNFKDFSSNSTMYTCIIWYGNYRIMSGFPPPIEMYRMISIE